MIRIIFISVFSSFYFVSSYAQGISEKELKNTVNKIADLISSNYVLEERGKEIAVYFIEDYKNGRFSSAEDWKQLDSIMTQSLKEVSKDGHLFTWHNKEIIQHLKQEELNKKKDLKIESDNFFNSTKAVQSNYGFPKIEVLPDNIGYLKLSEINISENSLNTLFSAMNFIINTDFLIIDLRNNRGGGSTVGPVLETFFFTEKKDFLEFTTRNGIKEIHRTVPWLLERRYTKPVYILINKQTASAAEAFAFVLKNTGRAVIIGEASAGAAYMNKYFLVNNELILAVSISAPFFPGTTMSWEQTGIQPDIGVEEEKALDKVLEIIKK